MVSIWPDGIDHRIRRACRFKDVGDDSELTIRILVNEAGFKRGGFSIS
jgi:hypothetical protein